VRRGRRVPIEVDRMHACFRLPSASR
jgi:hypothetical protein